MAKFPKDKKSFHNSGKKKRQYTSHSLTDSAVQAKKHLGQHFLKDESIAQKIADALTLQGYKNVIEIGPGTGVLTKFLLQKDIDLVAMELDRESVAYLNNQFPLEQTEIRPYLDRLTVVEADFLQFDLSTLFDKAPVAIVGNFPYNISTQIVFKMLEHKERIPEFTGMFQKEVAKRICEPEGSKAYGILSVLVQAFYTAEYLFTVHPQVFDPPPKVQSGVLRLIRKDNLTLECSTDALYKVVKTAFGQRRKTLRNSLKTLQLPPELTSQEIFSKRPEQLSVTEFIALTKQLETQL